MRIAVNLMATVVLALPAAARAQDVGLDLNTIPKPVTIEDLNGQAVDLAQYIGKKPVLLEFWATWCGLCKELEPTLTQAHKKYGSTVEFLIVAVGVGQTPRAILRHLEKHPAPGRMLWDGQGKAVRAFMAPGTSYVVVLDENGRVTYTGSGGDQKLEPVLAKLAAR